MSIFSTVNEDGKPAWQSVLDGSKTITRRTRPAKVGSIRRIQRRRTEAGICECGHPKNEHDKFGCCYANRGHPAAGSAHCDCNAYKPARIRIVSCEPEEVWIYRTMTRPIAECGDGARTFLSIDESHELLNTEANLEGFANWDGLLAVLRKTNPKNLPLYRIEFQKQ